LFVIISKGMIFALIISKLQKKINPPIMKKILIIQRIIFVTTLFFFISCSKKDEAVTPSTSTLAGKWKQNGSIGKLTYTSNGTPKGVELTEAPDGSVIEFKADGTALFEGEAVKYTVTGTAVSFNYGAGKPTIDFTVSKLTSTEMTTSYTKDQTFKYIERYYDTNDASIRDLIKNKATATLSEYTVNYIK
jgi:hypothetical protein